MFLVSIVYLVASSASVTPSDRDSLYLQSLELPNILYSYGTESESDTKTKERYETLQLAIEELSTLRNNAAESNKLRKLSGSAKLIADAWLRLKAARAAYAASVWELKVQKDYLNSDSLHCAIQAMQNWERAGIMWLDDDQDSAQQLVNVAKAAGRKAMQLETPKENCLVDFAYILIAISFLCSIPISIVYSRV